MGTELTALGEILGDGENVFRGLNPKLCEAGLPTEACFILKTRDRVNDGPSHGICSAPLEDAPRAPLGARQGVTLEVFSSLLPKQEYGVSRINVSAALAPVRDRGVAFIQRDDETWAEHARAHAMISGYQAFGNQELKDCRRYLVKLAAGSVVKAPVTSF